MAGAEYAPAVLEELELRVRAGLPRWRLSPGSDVRLLNVSENATYAVHDPCDGRELILRLHRVGYSSAAEIRSELGWMAALARDGVAETAAPIAGLDGDWVQVLAPAGEGAPRFAVAFTRLPGVEPDTAEAPRWFARLGELTARLHQHARGWRRPADFTRKRWDVAAMVGPQGFWGPWRAAPGLDAPGRATLERALDLVVGRLGRFGSDAAVFGLVHADLRLANLLVDGETLRIIDFDDCGFSWYLYDFATAVSFIEHEPAVPALLEAWCSGYARAAPLPPDARAELATFVILRRILLTAWLASHAEVPLARQMGECYTQGTVALAEEFLRGRLLTLG